MMIAWNISTSVLGYMTLIGKLCWTLMRDFGSNRSKFIQFQMTLVSFPRELQKLSHISLDCEAFGMR